MQGHRLDAGVHAVAYGALHQPRAPCPVGPYRCLAGRERWRHSASRGRRCRLGDAPWRACSPNCKVCECCGSQNPSQIVLDGHGSSAIMMPPPNHRCSAEIFDVQGVLSERLEEVVGAMLKLTDSGPDSKPRGDAPSSPIVKILLALLSPLQLQSVGPGWEWREMATSICVQGTPCWLTTVLASMHFVQARACG